MIRPACALLCGGLGWPLAFRYLNWFFSATNRPACWARACSGAAEVGDEGLVGEHAAVYADVLPGDERGLVRGEEHDHRRDVLGASEAEGQRVPQHGRVHRFPPGLLADHDEAGGYRVAPDPLLAELRRHVPGQVDQCGLG